MGPRICKKTSDKKEVYYYDPTGAKCSFPQTLNMLGTSYSQLIEADLCHQSYQAHSGLFIATLIQKYFTSAHKTFSFKLSPESINSLKTLHTRSNSKRKKTTNRGKRAKRRIDIIDAMPIVAATNTASLQSPSAQSIAASIAANLRRSSSARSVATTPATPDTEPNTPSTSNETGASQNTVHHV